MDYFSIDVESSGPAPGLYSLLSIGAVHVRRREGRYQLGETFYVELKPATSRVDPAAMAVNKLDLEKLKVEGQEPRAALVDLTQWVRAQQKDAKAKPVFVGHNAPFDWQFISYGFVSEGLPNPFGHSALCLKSLAMGKLRVGWTETSLRQMAGKLPELPAFDEARAHRADYDAWFQANVFAALMHTA